MNNICMDKKSFRTEAKAVRDSLNTVHCSNSITKKILQWQEYKKAKNVMIFSPIKSEISLLELLKDKTKNFYFPAIDGDEIYPVKYDKDLGFNKGKYNISEPIGEKIKDFKNIDLVFFPALAVDKNGYRLGYGKGYYDRFSQKTKTATKALPISSKLVYDKIPRESHDMPVDYIITEEEIITSNT